jgi:hypothetical protein
MIFFAILMPFFEGRFCRDFAVGGIEYEKSGE